MFYRSKIRQTSLALILVAMLLFGGILLPSAAPAAWAQDVDFSIVMTGAAYVTSGHIIHHL